MLHASNKIVWIFFQFGVQLTCDQTKMPGTHQRDTDHPHRRRGWPTQSCGLSHWSIPHWSDAYPVPLYGGDQTNK